MEISEAVEEIQGTCSPNLDEYAEACKISFDEFLEELSQAGIENCYRCGWWDEVGDIVDGEIYCDDCIKDYWAEQDEAE